MTQAWKNVEDNQEKDILWNKGRTYYLGKEIEGTICICKWNKWDDMYSCSACALLEASLSSIH